MENIILIIGSLFGTVFNLVVSVNVFVMGFRDKELLWLYAGFGTITMICATLSIWCLITTVEKDDVI